LLFESFHKVGDEINYSGYERDSSPLRNYFVQTQEGINALNTETKARKEIEKKFGVDYSVYMKLNTMTQLGFQLLISCKICFL